MVLVCVGCVGCVGTQWVSQRQSAETPEKKLDNSSTVARPARRWRERNVPSQIVIKEKNMVGKEISKPTGKDQHLKGECEEEGGKN